MFGNLFDDCKPAGVMSSIPNCNASASFPPPPRHPCGFSGIANQGATCYLNSLLQTLLFTPEFREGLFKLADDELGCIEDREKGGKVRIIPLQLQRIFARLLLVDQQAASTSELTESFGWSNKEGLQQHDVQELNRILFSAIESSLVGTSGSDLISKLYHGSTVSEIVCQMCGKISEKEEDFLDLNVIVAGFSSLQESLNATFLQKEMMKGKNQYRCSTCCNLVDAKKGLKIKCLPPILTLSLSRFSYDTVKGERYKETGRFVFPKEIDMASYCDKPLTSEDSLYELFSVVIHSGSSYGGHYHAYIRDVDFLGKWYPPNEEISVISDNGWEEFDCPLELIRMLLLQEEELNLPVDALCREISKRTGFSWNKRFKKSEGPITKFLQKHSDVFYLNPVTNVVYLRDNVPLPESMNEDNVSTSESSSEAPRDTKKSSVKSALKLNFFEKKKVQTDSHEVVENWYDFNDSRVMPLFVKDIEKQFSGKESAYMLFYRRKSLHRPIEAKGNPCYMMPLLLIELAEAENIELTKQRELYEATLNTIVILMHLARNYVFDNGALQPRDENTKPSEVVIDKRKSLLNLREVIWETYNSICNQPLPIENMHLYTAKELPAGLHLVKELCEPENQSLKDIGIQEGCKIFVCEGNEVGVPVGPLCEPVLLHFTAIQPTGEPIEISRGFPKCATLRDLKLSLSDLLNLKLEDMVLSRMDLQGDNTQIAQLEQQLSCSVSDLCFADGDSLIVESFSYKSKFADKKEEQTFSIMVQNNCSSLGEPMDCDMIEVAVDPAATVGALKSLAMSKLSINNSRQYMLRTVSENGMKGPPLHENQNLKSNGLSEVKCVSLEEGEPPQNDEIVLKFGVKGIAGDFHPMEISVNKRSTVQQCLKLMLTEAGLKGDSWQLQKTNWCGEPMETLFLETATLEDENIHHKDFLYVTTGHVPPKGFISLTIWLYPTFENLQVSQASLNGIISDYERLYRSIFVIVEHECGLVKLGEVELSADSSLAELKKQILTLPHLKSVSLPNVKFLRLRLIDGSRPGKILRCLTNTLRKLKIKSHQSLCVQLLPYEEDLTQNELLLNICQRIPESRTYTPPSELAWDTSKSATPKALKQSISECIGIPAHRLVIAKHFPEKFNWLIIEENFNQKKSSKSRWSSKKSNLRYSPYFIRDGDTIGVKDQMMDQNDSDDFNTKEDIEGQEILRIAAEGKRQRRQSRNSNGCSDWMVSTNDSESTRFSKKSEAGIIIYVDDFR